MFSFAKDGYTDDIFKGNTLIIPAVSVGNVGQLSCDLIVSTFQLERVGYFCLECFLPLIGNNPFATSKENESVLTLNSEVFNSAEKKITVLQIRSPLVKGKECVFRKSIIDWMDSSQFKEVIILSSCHAYERTDEQLTGPPFRYLLSPSMNYLEESFTVFKWKRLEERNVGSGDRILFLPGGGFTKKLFQDCCEADVPAAVSLVFCAEGDNVPEAMSMVNYLNQWKRYLDIGSKWKPPFSWVHLFGNAPPNEIF